MFLPENVKTIIEQLETAGYEAYAVGGCVRDSLGEWWAAELVPLDYDIATSAVPVEIREVFRDYRIVDIGEKHGTIAVIIDDNKIEITSFRTDGDYSDSRHPDNVVFTRDLKSDLSRRDFTVNAMAYSEATGLVDLFGGRQDLDSNILRCVGDPEKRFSEDALRIMRALRFMSERGFILEENTEQALRELKDNLLKIAPERIAMEFDRLLLGEHAEKVITEYYDVLGVIFPDLISCAGFDQHNKHHIYDVLTHIAKAISAAPKDIVIRLALFFHDIAKPKCFELKDGIGHAPGHPVKSAEIAEKTMRRLRYNKATIYKVVLLVENHREKLRDDVITVKSLLNKYGPKTLIQLCELKIADDNAKAGFVKLELHKHRLVIEKAREVIKSGECYTLGGLAVNGNDLIELGYSGRDIGKRLKSLLDTVITGRAENRREVLLEIAEKGLK
ncbi:MAG: HD domain-containing protein [Oscillospiraceae bacterium]|jgi:tRNA nucleotidyltransferase (CCA-adding enzyme)|nr:HD domain-containing protein [Oscillospiraceae bacterium]